MRLASSVSNFVDTESAADLFADNQSSHKNSDEEEHITDSDHSFTDSSSDDGEKENLIKRIMKMKESGVNFNDDKFKDLT